MVIQLELNLTEEQKEHAKFFGVEESHYQRIINQSGNLTKEDFYLSLGNLHSDCIKFKIAAEQLGFRAREVGEGYHGYPSLYHLTKVEEEAGVL